MHRSLSSEWYNAGHKEETEICASKVSAINAEKSMFSSIYSFWNTYGPDIQSGAVVLSAIAAFLIIGAHRRNTTRRNTLDLILHQQSDRELIEAREKFNELKSGSTKLVTYASLDERASKNFEAIRTVLNIHELTSVSICEGVIDERVYRSWFNTAMISDFEATEAFIKEIRRNRDAPKAFCEFEAMARRWKDSPYEDGFWTRKRKAIRYLKSA
ncbi:DUF4760 domain-containing protein [Qipengyuania marisflavi]|uniref:DUF4760 domain-containing protein n=1 Tax=Qipengyuania marisflavi TaxID=2486356 RepID=A0A5S3P306_9SPHN|nr:DUF4760 domain-containing protein [Qipengyuania marisflavi]TMM47160.1 DUF4760 domain-containing protein [Qipengyuania marisflavi]